MYYIRQALGVISIFVTLFMLVKDSTQQTSFEVPSSIINSEHFYIDLHHKFGLDTNFAPRATILVKPKTDLRPAHATLVQQKDLSQEEIERLKLAYERDELYYLKSDLKTKRQNSPIKSSQVILKACSLYVSNLTDTLSINLSPTNQFLSVNLRTTDPECLRDPLPLLPTNKFTTTLSVETGAIGPQPDTVTYIKRLEEERLNKLKEGKEDNRSFFAKYWIYIVPAVVILMMMSGPDAQQGR